MTPEPISERVSRLAGEALSAQARMVRESVEVSREAWQPGADPAALSKAWTELVTTEGQRYWQAVATIGLDAARDLLALNTRTSAAVLRGLSEASTGRRHAAGAPEGEAGADRRQAHRHDDGREAVRHGHRQGHDDSDVTEAAPEVKPRTDGLVTLSGVLGSTAYGSLTVVNRHPRSRRVVVTAGVLRDGASDEVCAVAVGIQPSRVTVPSGQERRVEIAVPLDPSAIRPGRVYVGTIEVSGGDEARVDLVVSADPAD
jgi:predicted transcriptional regulator